MHTESNTTGLDRLVTVNKPHGGSYHIVLPGGDMGRIEQVLSGGRVYEQPLLQEIYNLHLKGRVIDVGAHIGNHSLWFAEVCGMTVESFEPERTAYRCLKLGIEANQLQERVRPHRVALGAGSSLGGEWDPETKGLVNPKPGGDIPMRTLDSYEFTDVSLIKVDVEGNEHEVLRGSVHTLKRCRPVVYAEARSKAARSRIQAVLEGLGYELSHLVLVASPLGCWRPR